MKYTNYPLIIFDYLFQLLESGKWDVADAVSQAKSKLNRFSWDMDENDIAHTGELLDRFLALTR